MNHLSMDKKNNRNEENTIISVNYVPEVNNLSDHNENKIYTILKKSDKSPLELMKWPQVSFNVNNYEENYIVI